MATKAIYTKIGDKYFRVNQSTHNPSNIVRMPKTHSQMRYENADKSINTNIWINGIDDMHVKSNKELYDEMIHSLRLNKVTSVDTIQNHYVMYCDYSIIDDNGKIINHNIATRVLPSNDAVYVLGAGSDCELVYKQVKMFETEISCTIRNEYPMGIMRNVSMNRYYLQINDVAVYQNISNDMIEDHPSMNRYGAATVSDILQNMVRMYSTYDNGVIISAVEVPFIPKALTMKFNIVLDSNIVVYDNQVIDAILVENIMNPDGDYDNEPEYPTQIFILNGGNASSDSNDDSIVG